MSLKQTYTLAHTAQCKLHIAANRPDRNLRFVVGHAMHLDSLMLRIVEIEEGQEVEQPDYSTAIKFKGAANQSAVGGSGLPSKSPAVKGGRKSPPPRLREYGSSDEDEGDSDEIDDEVDEMLSLTRFESASARPPRQSPVSTQPPPLIPSDDDSEEEDGPPSPEGPGEDLLRTITQGKSNEDLMLWYNHMTGCPCQKSNKDAPKIQKLWELNEGEKGGKGNVRRAVVQVGA